MKLWGIQSECYWKRAKLNLIPTPFRFLLKIEKESITLWSRMEERKSFNWPYLHAKKREKVERMCCIIFWAKPQFSLFLNVFFFLLMKKSNFNSALSKIDKSASLDLQGLVMWKFSFFFLLWVHKLFYRTDAGLWGESSWSWFGNGALFNGKIKITNRL